MNEQRGDSRDTKINGNRSDLGDSPESGSEEEEVEKVFREAMRRLKHSDGATEERIKSRLIPHISEYFGLTKSEIAVVHPQANEAPINSFDILFKANMDEPLPRHQTKSE